MRRSILLVPLFALLPGACSERAPSPTELDVSPDLAAVVFTENLKVEEEILVFVPCAAGGVGEEVLLTGTLHLLFHVTENKNGFHVKFSAHPQGISGVGLTTGDKYQATGVTQDNTNVGPGETFTLVNNFRIIGQGPGNNFLIHETFHVTINANGELTALVENFSVDCK